MLKRIMTAIPTVLRGTSIHSAGGTLQAPPKTLPASVPSGARFRASRFTPLAPEKGWRATFMSM